MPRASNIRWRKSDAEKLSRAVGQFNAKRTRVLKKDPAMVAFQPERENVKELRELIQTRADFNRILARLKRYTKKGSEALVNVPGSDVITTKFALAEVTRNLRTKRTRNERIKKELNLGPTTGTMGTIKELNLNDSQIDLKKVPQSKWGDYVKLSEKKLLDSYEYEKQLIYRDNFIKGLNKVFGSKGDQLVEKIKTVPLPIIIEWLQDAVLNLDYVYGAEAIEVRLENFTASLEGFLGGWE